MTNPLDLTNRRILVTGASAGIGRSTARLLSQLGAKLVLIGRNLERLHRTLGELEGSDHRITQLDLDDLDQIPSTFAEIVNSVGPLHGLVHCAGLTAVTPLPLVTTANIDRMMRVNFSAAVILTKEFSRK